MKRVRIVGSAFCFVLLLSFCPFALAQQPAATLSPANAATLFQNARIFDGKNGTISAPSNVLVP